MLLLDLGDAWLSRWYRAGAFRAWLSGRDWALLQWGHTMDGARLRGRDWALLRGCLPSMDGARLGSRDCAVLQIRNPRAEVQCGRRAGLQGLKTRSRNPHVRLGVGEARCRGQCRRRPGKHLG